MLVSEINNTVIATLKVNIVIIINYTMNALNQLMLGTYITIIYYIDTDI